MPLRHLDDAICLAHHARSATISHDACVAEAHLKNAAPKGHHLSPADLAPDLVDALRVLYAPDYHFFGEVFDADCVICKN